MQSSFIATNDKKRDTRGELNQYSLCDNAIERLLERRGILKIGNWYFVEFEWLELKAAALVFSSVRFFII